MQFGHLLSKIILGVCIIVIYMMTFYYGYSFFHAYSYLGHTQIVIGALCIMGIGIGFSWAVIRIFGKLYSKTEIVVSEEKVVVELVEEKETRTPRMIQNEKDKKIKNNYQKLLIEYKKNLPSTEYKKFQEETKYDILIYDALMINHDKNGELLKNLQKEKSVLYIDALKKILD